MAYLEKLSRKIKDAYAHNPFPIWAVLARGLKHFNIGWANQSERECCDTIAVAAVFL
jgi:hypothetical protein